MSRLPSLKPKEVLKKLKSLGFVEDHITGSHIILYHPATKRRAVVPFHLKDIHKGTLSSILREAGVTRVEFLSA